MHTLHTTLVVATRLCVALALVLAPRAELIFAGALAAPRQEAMAVSGATFGFNSPASGSSSLSQSDSRRSTTLATPNSVITVSVGNSSKTFSPDPQTIAVGDSIHWLWTDGGTHSTTRGVCSGGSCTQDTTSVTRWDSGTHAQMNFTFDHVFTETGSFSYYCSIHGPFFGMQGTIEVFGPIAGLTAANSSPTPLGSATAFTATLGASNVVTYTWGFGDGQTDSGALVSHTYANSGLYTAVVTASNPISTVVAYTPVTITRSLYLPLVIR